MSVHGKQRLSLVVHVDDILMGGRKQNVAPMWKTLMELVHLDERTSFLDHVYVGCTQRECKPNEDIINQKREMFELEICRWRDAICNLQRTDTEKDVWIQESNWESGTQDSPRQDEDSLQPEHHQFGHKKAYWSRWHEHRNIDKKWKREIFGPENLVLPSSRDNRNQEPDQGSLGDFPQIRTRVDIKKPHAQTSSTAFRRHSFSDYLLRSGNMGTKQKARKNDSINTTQDATTHYQTK